MLSGLACLPNSGYSQDQKQGFRTCSPEIEAKIATAVSELKYQDALNAAEQLEQEAITKYGKESRCYGGALSERATVIQLLNRGIEASPIFEAAVKLLRRYSGPQDPKLALSLNNYGVNLYWLHRFQEFARAHEEALDLRRNLQPSDLAAVAESLHNLADAYRHLN